MPKYEYLTHKQMNQYYSDVVQQIALDDFKPDVVIAPMRGGADFGIKLSNYFNVRFEPIVWQTRDGSRKDIQQYFNVLENYRNDNILLVDDICDSGETLRDLIDIAVNQGTLTLKTAVAIQNMECDIECDYAAREILRSEEPQWFIFPWEDWWKG